MEIHAEVDDLRRYATLINKDCISVTDEKYILPDDAFDRHTGMGDRRIRKVKRILTKIR